MIVNRDAPAVALFPSSYAPHLGGVEELSKRLALQLRARGGDTVVVTNRWPTELPAEEIVEDVPVYRERFRFPEPKPRHLAGWLVGTGTTRRNIDRILSGHRSEVIHVQCVSSNGYYALRAARTRHLPLVVSLQGELTMDAGQIYQRSATMRRSWRRLLEAADVVTGCSQQVVDEAVDAYGPELASKARVVRNGVDLARVRAAEPERRERPYILGIGRLVPQKGFDLLLDGFVRIADAHPDIELVLAGDGPERPQLEEVARSSRFRERIHFLGGVPAERAFSLFRGASAFVLSSRHEPQGIVVVEAMAAGAPVLAARVGGVPETVHDGTNGLLFDGGDPASLARGLAVVLDDSDAARERAMRAQDDVQAYDWARITDEYHACYQEALHSHSLEVRPHA